MDFHTYINHSIFKGNENEPFVQCQKALCAFARRM